MSLDTYANLQASIASFLNREDLTSQIPDFITLAEARFNRELRVNDMLKKDYISASAGTADLPDDWLQHVSVVVSNNSTARNALDYVSPEEYNDLLNDKLTGVPRYYTIIDKQLLVLPYETSSVDLDIFYYAKIKALASSNTTNWLLTRSPDLYLYASLIQAEAYLQNDERIGLWAAGADKAMADIKMESERAKRPQGALAARRRTFG
jgi:hypothetical protein